EMAKPGEITGITLHSDGYANHPSPNAEAKTLQEVCDKLQDKPVFVNTIAYSDYSDFRLLARVANEASGTCIKAGDIKEVYDAINDTVHLLDGSMTPTLEEPLSPDYNYQVFVSHAGGKCLGGPGPLSVRGIKVGDDAAVYKYRKLSKKEYDALKDVPVKQT